MKVTIRNRFLLLLFGWGLFPREVEATVGLWWQWARCSGGRVVVETDPDPLTLS